MTLRELIDSEAANAARTDQAVLDWLEEMASVWQEVPWLELQIWLHAEGIDRAALNTAATAGTAANKTAAQHILDTITAGMPLYATDSRVRDIVGASSLDGAAKAALVALAQRNEVRWMSASVDWNDALTAEAGEQGRRLYDVNTARIG